MESPHGAPGGPHAPPDPLGRPGPRPGALSDLEAKLIAAAVARRLFDRPADPVQLGRYRLQERLGQGGMGVVFRAHDPQLRRDVAVKLLHTARTAGPAREQHARLRREALALGRVSHPNIVQVYEVGEDGDHVFVVMEYVRGVTMRAWLAQQPRTPAEILGVALQVGRGLAAAHAAGIIHRDLKPENVLVGADGRARVVDFGLARAVAAPVGDTAGSLAAPLTRTGTVLGTPAFMAPEQVEDPARADARADQFSYCVLVYEALHGERPYADLGAAAVRPAPPDRPVDPAVRAVLLRGLQRDPGDRWDSMDALLAALERAVDVPAPAAAPPAPRRLAAALALAAALVTAIAALVVDSIRRQRALTARIADLDARLRDLDPAAAERLLAGLVAADDPRVPATLWAEHARRADPPAQAARAWAHAYALSPSDAAAHEALRGLAGALPGDPGVRALLLAEAPTLARELPDAAPPRSPTAPPDAATPPRNTATPPDAASPPRNTAASPDAIPPRNPAAPPDATPPRNPAAPPDAAHPRNIAAPPDAAPPRSPTAPPDAASPPRNTAASPDAAHPRNIAASPDAASPDAAPPDAASPPRNTAADSLAAAGLPPRVVALARAGLPQLAADVALTLAPASPARRAWHLAVAPLLADRSQARALRLDALDADDPAVRDPARAALIAAEIAAGALDEAAALDLHLAAPVGESARAEAAAVRARLDITLAARAAVPLRLLPPAWSDLDAAAVRRDPVAGALELHAHEPGPLVTWPIEQVGERLLVDLDLGLHAGALTLRVADAPALECDARDTLDLDLAARTLTCRAADRTTTRPLPADFPGARRLELRAGAGACTRASLTRAGLTGARLAPADPPALTRAAALLADRDPVAAAAALADLPGADARALHALALALAGGPAPALADPAADLLLRRWLRDDPGLAPALRRGLGEPAYLELFARAWSTELAAAEPSPELTRLLLDELAALEARCSGPACPDLLRARGRALAQTGEPARARRALEAALASAPSDAAGRALASQILVDLTVVKADTRSSLTP
ncbi:MAG: protein kinase [Myxococcales bacterium]|nr:protein kinase [Myxococcales bacterium]